jgi:AAA15 family ATPase/GTPase
MIKKLSIQNFKSIKGLQLDCKRINIFVGDPNAGKSNILEAFTFLNVHKKLKDFVRFREISHLFHDYDSTEEIVIKADDITSRVWIESDSLRIESRKGDQIVFQQNAAMNGEPLASTPADQVIDLPRILSYKYNPDVVFGRGERLYLEAPFGQNLPSVLLSNKELHSIIKNLLDDFEYKLLIKPLGDDFEIIRDRNGSFISFPLVLMSDSLKRIIFNLAVVKSNENSIILLEEPEAKTFPFYIKALAEMMAKQDKNQYFVVTHNSHFLTSAIEKTPVDELTVNLVYTRDYSTELVSLTPNQIESVLDYGSDFFINFNKFIEA